MDESNPWAVWRRVPNRLLEMKAKSSIVDTLWVMASPGEEGLEEIAGPRGFPKSLLAALPLAQLRSTLGFAELFSPSTHRSPWLLATARPWAGYGIKLTPGATILDRLLRENA